MYSFSYMYYISTQIQYAYIYNLMHIDKEKSYLLVVNQQ